MTPEATLRFEEALRDATRELARQVLEWTLNAVEPESPETQPHDIHVGGVGYRRLNQKTPHRNVATLFGPITLWRRGYRSWCRDDREPTLFPLELDLGLREGTTPALASRITHRMGEAGVTQGLTLSWLKQEHGVAMGVPRLRKLCDVVAAGLEEQREDWQVQRLLGWLSEAQQSSGRNRPVLSVGRDGVTFNVGGFYEVGSTATLSVYDRSGQRLGTVYLAQPSEHLQATLSDQLTRLITRTLQEYEGPPPRLCYVTDAGDAETSYYRDVLRGMRDPRNPQRRLHWIRVVDYFHVSQRLATLADALRFASDRDRQAWIVKMRKLLKKPGGVGRVLHSAAALVSRLGLKKAKASEFEKARRYLRNQSRFANYAECQQLGLPIGSGVTEAACKTIFTQRLKLSGMQWKRSKDGTGAQTILRLRVVLLSRIWNDAFLQFLSYNHPHIEVHGTSNTKTSQKAA